MSDSSAENDLPDLFDLVGDWLPLPDVAEEIGLDIIKVRRLLEERALIASRVGERNVLQVPAAFLKDGEVLPPLRGTIVVLSDGGYQDDESIRWLFTEDESLPGRPIDALRAGRKSEIRRRAQVLAF